MTKKSTDKTNGNEEPQTMEELLETYGSSIKIPQRGTFTDGVVTFISPKEVRVDVGSKIEGIVMSKEMELFKDLIRELKVGDQVQVYVVSSENKQGQLILSIRRHMLDLKWARFKEALEKGETVTIRGLEINRGGCICNAEGLQGFLPTSQMDPSRLPRLNELINRLLPAKVIEVNQKENRLIFSEKLLMEEANIEKAEEIKKVIDTQKLYDAEVTGVTNFGAFVKVSMLDSAGVEMKVDGLIHISEISWDKVEKVEDHLKAGERLQILVLGVDEKTGKLNCSLKRLKDDPWVAIAANFSVDEKVEGVVRRVADYGVFVELIPNFEGLIHISKVPPGQAFKVGDKINCVIETIEPEKRKISLIPQLEGKFIGYR